MNRIHIAISYFALAFLMSCSENLFGSSSSGSCGDKDLKCLRLEADNAFSNSKCKEAYSLYKKMVEADSTASAGYFGLAQAGLCWKGVNPFDVFRFADLNKLEDGQIPFNDDSIKVQNRYYQGMTLASNALMELNRRDSLTNLWNLHLNEPQGGYKELPNGYASIDTLNKDLNIFRSEFGPSSYKGFPLIDREYEHISYYAGLLVSTMAKAMLKFSDWNNDYCITKGPEYDGVKSVDYPANEAEWKGRDWGCCGDEKIKEFGECKGKFGYDKRIALNSDGTIDTEKILDDIKDNLGNFYDDQLNSTDTTDVPQDIEVINDKINDFGNNLDEVISILGGSDGGSDWQAEMSKYKNYASFFKVATRLDEDGDGCIDEELLNGLDNDGDGLSGEDARLASIDPAIPAIWGKIGANHVMMYNENFNDPKNLPMFLPQNAKKYICNEAPEPDCAKKTNLRFDEQGNITVLGFTQEPGYWTSDSLELKLEVAQDYCGTKYNLEQRKNLVGGCWLFYTEEQFNRIWKGRHCGS